jgi:hypothetical protein
MRPFPLLAALMTAAIVAGAALDPEHWFGDNALLVAVASLAFASVAFSWWELWSSARQDGWSRRHDGWSVRGDR